MLTVSEAISALLAEAKPRPPQRVKLFDALGRVAAEDIVCDLDSPPFDKSLMDGYALRAADVASGSAALRVIEEVTAGTLPSKTVGSGEATRIMTGAPLPDGADAVVRVEETEWDAAAGIVRVRTDRAAPGANIMRRGTAKKAGDRVLPAGRILRPQELGALAEMGKHEVAVWGAPRVAVLATGDELVPISQTPGPGQIRNSNETMLCAQVSRAGGAPVPLGIARDERSHLRKLIGAGLEADVLILSGGVSAGKLDLVPSELTAAGVRPVFHQVDLRPGKPTWFGVRDGDASAGDNPSAGRCYVFGLPGNPVSSLVCFELFVRTLLRRLMGVEPAEPRPIRARLSQVHVARGDRPTYNPARLEWDDSGPRVTPVPWHGSSDLQATVDANAMACFPAGEATYPAGESIDVIGWD